MNLFYPMPPSLSQECARRWLYQTPDCWAVHANTFSASEFCNFVWMALGPARAWLVPASSVSPLLLLTLLPWKNMRLTGNIRVGSPWMYSPTSSSQGENIKRLLHSEVQNSSALYERIWGAPNKANSLEQAFVTKTHHAGPQASKPDKRGN